MELWPIGRLEVVLNVPFLLFMLSQNSLPAVSHDEFSHPAKGKLY